ncbi:MAG: 16S rRNA (cytosine(1402)-N(4))-methyltransferase RsmH [Verrucomicrobia bacterium]|jgi:16S rRNA (cytosine1402-N4)-methyltransferase|nr:16S rRNA (cytosine(1402)-N(4))-methyltransferase RsmH [Verrucomicrobiota bacterium]
MSEESPAPHRRRPRYSGRNPRRFEEKYKEHRPDQYSDDVAKVIASGKTPAGSHRSIMVREILEVLKPLPGETAIDATLGYGGHAVEILHKLLPGGRLLGLDADPIELPKTESRMREMGFGPEQLTLMRSNFAGLPKALAKAGFPKADCILADLGLSSMQIDNPARGFTFKWEGPFDLRLNPERGQPASKFVASLTIDKLATVLGDHADEPHSAVIAPALIEAADQNVLSTTLDAASVVKQALEKCAPHMEHSDINQTIRRVFQAIRIGVNDEFGALESFLRCLPGCLAPRGRVAILTFHSGEDRRVKKAFQTGLRSGLYSSVADQITRPQPEEIRSNPRASPAKLRWAVSAED